MKKKNSNPRTILKLEEVTKTYFMDGDLDGDGVEEAERQKVVALDNVSVKIHSGEFIAIIGPSGSGKSTLMHIMGLLDIPTHGRVFLKNTNTSKFSEAELATLRNTQIGFVFQQFNLLARTSASGNVQLPLVYSGTHREERKRLAKKMLTRVGLEKRMRNTPAQLSGGQQQRVAIARALINNPTILFADEPTGNLDTKTGKEIMKLFEDLHHEGKTVILVTHEQEVARYTHRIISLRDGKIVSDIKNGHRRRTKI